MLSTFIVLWIAYSYILWRWGRWKGAPNSPEIHQPAKLSTAVLIPVRNEEKTLRRCLDSLLSQEYVPQEIWIIDDHSEDNTLSVALSYVAAHPQIKVLSLPPGHEGKKAALLHGMAHVKAELIITTDGDTYHPPDTIRKLIAPFANPSVQVAGGWVRLQTAPTFLNAFQRIEMGGVLLLTAGSWKKGEPLTANGALLAYRLAAFRAVGGWGEATRHPSGDDDLLVQRIRKRYGAIALAFTDAVVETQAAPTWRDLIYQRLRWLSKRHLYIYSWTRVGLALIALTQASFVLSSIFYPSVGVPVWGIFSLIQVLLVRRVFMLTSSPPPLWWEWILASIAYPVYQIFLALLALTRPSFQWKNRQYSV
ncbi:MAG: glycosyltransferase [Bacteroidia bacterium]|nr:glycosyltransferase [Bacteroidia bacterium]